MGMGLKGAELLCMTQHEQFKVIWDEGNDKQGKRGCRKRGLLRGGSWDPTRGELAQESVPSGTLIRSPLVDRYVYCVL